MREPQKFYRPAQETLKGCWPAARQNGARGQRTIAFSRSFCVRWGNEISFRVHSRNAVAGFMAHRAVVIACLPRGERGVASVISFTFAAHAILQGLLCEGPQVTVPRQHPPAEKQ